MGTIARWLAVLLAMAVPLQAQPPAGAGAAGAVPATVRAAWILGQELFDAEGKPLGTIRDLLIERDRDRVAALEVGSKERVGSAEGAPPASVALAGAALGVRAGGGLELRGAAAASAAAPSAPPARPFRRATEIMEAQLREREGAAIAEVNDVTVRLEDGAVVHLVVQFDPEAYRSEGEVALPIGSVEPQGPHFIARFDASALRPVKTTASAPASRLSRLLGARVVDKDERPVGRVADVVIGPAGRKVTHLVIARSEGRGEAVHPFADARFARVRGVPQATVDAAALARAPAPAPAAVRGSRLLEARIDSPQGGEVGRVEDVVVNLRSGALHFVVARFTPDWVRKGMLAAVPPRAAERRGDSGPLAIRVGLNELNAAYLFPDNRWPDVSNPTVRAEIDRYVAR